MVSKENLIIFPPRNVLPYSSDRKQAYHKRIQLFGSEKPCDFLKKIDVIKPTFNCWSTVQTVKFGT